ncbi:ATP-dependent DNA helicase [Temperatibacter marinus]|uniref:ATP-dependent DNA helicase n=1 Tax=Temperatibacter marinus TaxID=1456591 RepID=A0AA52EDS5_9PROT|nr:ATP-dependent DNA helicase [Temperatibacter marinus]WND03617.1 ATP-dependent DNA helicase [Temperatibacter marinus]
MTNPSQRENKTHISLKDLPAMAVGVSAAVRLSADGELTFLDLIGAADAISRDQHLVVNMPLVARRLGLGPFRSYDILELYAFTRPARFALPTLKGLMQALMQSQADMPQNLEDEVIALQEVAQHLITDLASETYAYRGGALSVASDMARSGWAWGQLAVQALSPLSSYDRQNGLAFWQDLTEIEDHAPPPPADDQPVESKEALSRLKALLGPASESREGQQRYASAAIHGFRPREMASGPNFQLLEAGTGTGKTLGYIAPASLWAEKNEGSVWLSTYTKNLQRQLDQELSKLYPDPKIKAKRAVVRKGRENYACILNIEETIAALKVRQGADRDRILMGLVVRWARFSRDGDMIGGDFPNWLGAHFGHGRIMGLTDRRGECLFTGCTHYRKCFIEKAVRKARQADLVIANHALVMAQAVMRKGDPDLPKRLVFDEGHHLFDAADSSFSAHLSGMEGTDLRRWLRGKEQGSRSRARGLEKRLAELIVGDEEATDLISHITHAARILPAEGWQNRLQSQDPYGAFELFLQVLRTHILTRSEQDTGPHSIEVSPLNPIEGLTEAATILAQELSQLTKPMKALAKHMLNKLAEEADEFDAGERGKLESTARSLSLRADQVFTWQVMASDIGGEIPEGFTDWFELDRIEGRERDIGMHRHFIDPTKPLAQEVLEETHGVLVTSATLRDKSLEGEEEASKRWGAADMRVGATHMAVPAKRLSLESPFDYAKNTRILIVGDVNKNDVKQVAGAYKALMLAAGGGALGLFTAISRLKATYHAMAADLESYHIPLYAQHVDPIDVSTLVDIFREDKDACLLGTDAVRDGVDVPGSSLRLLIYDRVPWPRPTLLHRARRTAFGGRGYDEMLTRLKLAQAYGRLVRRATDRGVFVMLDGATPTRLLSAMPEGVEIERIGIREAIQQTRDFFRDL